MESQKTELEAKKKEVTDQTDKILLLQQVSNNFELKVKYFHFFRICIKRSEMLKLLQKNLILQLSS